MADPLDLLDLDEAKRAINMEITTSEQDDILARHVTTISRIVDDMCGPAVQRAVTAERHDGGQAHIHLRRRPVLSVTLVRESRYGTIETIPQGAFGSTLDAYDAARFDRDPTLLSGELVRILGGFVYVWWPGVNNVEVTYEAGRFADTAAVDARFKDAASAVLRRLWKREAGSWAQSSTFFTSEDPTAGTGFFRVAEPVISELLYDDVQSHALGFA